MSIGLFDVVELKNNTKATVLKKIDANTYFAEIVNNEGITIDNRNILQKEINKVIYSNKY